MDVGDLVGSRTPEGAGIDSGRDSVGGCCWFREMDGKPDARGRGYRSGQGLRRGIQLRFRKVDGKPDARGSWHFQLVEKNINTWQGTEADGVLSWNCESVAVSAQLFSINAEEFRS